MCGSFYFLYISLAEILVFSNDSYFFVNIENMEENGNMINNQGIMDLLVNSAKIGIL